MQHERAYGESPFPFPVPPPTQAAPTFAFPPPAITYRPRTTLETIGEFLETKTLPVRNAHLYAARWFLLGTFVGLAFGSVLVIAFRPTEPPAAARVAVEPLTTGARTMLLFRPAVAVQVDHGPN